MILQPVTYDFQYSMKIPNDNYIKCHFGPVFEELLPIALEELSEIAIEKYRENVGSGGLKIRITSQTNFEGEYLYTFEIEGMGGFDPEDRIISHAY